MSETPEKPKDPVAAAVVETWWDMKEQRDRWRSVAEQLAKGRPGMHLGDCICVECCNWREALAAFDSLRKEEK